MAQPEADPWLGAFTLALIVASVLVWGYLFARLIRVGRILEYEPRRPVPWGWPAAILAVLFVLTALLAGDPGSQPEQPPVIPNPLEAAERIAGIMLFQLIVTGAALAVATAVSKPNLADIGLPHYVDRLLSDVRVGCVAWLAALAPVFGLLLLARFVLRETDDVSHHPLIDTVFREQSFGVLALASISVVIVAPICEEIVFRLLLQGWLEKWEHGHVGWREVRSNDEARMTNDEFQIGNVEPTPNQDSSLVIRNSSLSTDQPPSRGVAGMPHGWAPILISSTLFALAHFGYGPEPVPLFALALILGYVYQQTHRIIPCIVTHALFNLITVIALWRMIGLSAE